MIRSVRHAASVALRKERKGQRRASGAEPPWPGPAGRLRWRSAGRSPGTWARLTVLALWLGAFTAVSYLPHGSLHLSIPAATTSLLSVIWQVQSATVGLVFALAVFVFGLLQGRGRLTYREFLRRTSALPLVTFNVASLLFNGMVLLGAGRQVAGSAADPGHGWAVTEASVIALASTVTIVIVLAGTLRAIDPGTEADVRRTYRETAVALAARGELLQDKSLEVMTGTDWPAGFAPAYSGQGRTIAFAGPGQATVRDVSVWRLRLLSWAADLLRRSQPVVQAWPGKPVSTGSPLVTVDASSTWLEWCWARWSVSLRSIPSDRLGDALAALHGETLEHIRAARPAEAVAGMRALGGLQQLLWQAYAAHGRAYRQDAGRVLLRYGRGSGDLIGELLDDLLRAAAVSSDAAIQHEASALPRVIAREAMYGVVPAGVGQALGKLEGVYIAIAGDLSDGGERALPGTGLARSRLDAPFGSLLSFTGYYLGQAIDQAASGGNTGWDRRRLPSGDYLVSQLQAANEAMLSMLRRAVWYGDSVTALRVLAVWKMPDLPLAQDAAGTPASASAGPAGGNGTSGPPGGLAQAIADAETGLDAMLLRLLVTAVDADRTAQRKAPPAAAHAGDPNSGEESTPDPVAQAILARLPDGGLWQVLETAIATSDRDWTRQAADDEIPVSGAVTIRNIDTLGPLTEAFAMAAVACPRLVSGTAPSGELALGRGQSLITAVDQVLAGQQEWLGRNRCPPDAVAVNADGLKEQLRSAIQDAQTGLDRKIRSSPVRAEATDEMARLALAAFRERDIAGVLFARAGKTATAADLPPLTMPINAERRFLTAAGDNEWAIDNLGRRLGAGLAILSLQLLALTAARDVRARSVNRQDAPAAIRDAIEDLSGRRLTGPERRPAARVLILIPDLGYTDRNALQIDRATQAGSTSAATSTALRRFGIEAGGLAAQVAGTIEGVPVIETSLRGRNVVAVDIARFGELRRKTPHGTGPAAPQFGIFEPDDPLRPAPRGSAAAGAAPVAEPVPDQMQVQVWLSIETGVEVEDPSAIRVISLE